MNFTSIDEFVRFWQKQIEIERNAEIHHHLGEIIQWWRARERKLKAICSLKSKIVKEVDEMVLLRLGRDKLIETEIKVGDVALIVDSRFYEELKKTKSFDEALQLANNYPLGNLANVGKHFLEVWVQKPLPPFVFKGVVDVQLYVNDVTFRRQLEGLEIFKKRKWRLFEKLKDLFLGKKVELEIAMEDFESKLRLNPYQIKFIAKGLKSRDFLILHWPFGTGKTTTLVELVYQLTPKNKKILVAGDSNTAVDNFLYKFSQFKIFAPGEVVRVGPISSLGYGESIWEYSIFNLLQNHSKYSQLKAIEVEVEKIKKKQKIFLKPTPALRRWLSDMQIHRLAASKKTYRGLKAKQLQSMSNWLLLAKQIERLLDQKDKVRGQIIEDILENAKVVVATNSMVLSDFLKTHWFDVAVIDEGSQATLPSTLLPIIAADRFLIAGDHRQLPPTVVSPQASALKISLFEQLIDLMEKGFFTRDAYEMLRIQYRMNEVLMEFPNQEFYGGLLEAAPEVKGITLVDLVGKQESEILKSDDIVVRFDVKGEQILEQHSKSLMNLEEIEVIQKVVKDVLNIGVNPQDIGIITPYAAQKARLKSALEWIEDLEINTIDGFQGREKEVIIISWVRTRWEGFLVDQRRFNVAITRSKRLLINIGNVNNFMQINLFKEYINYIKKYGKLVFLPFKD